MKIISDYNFKNRDFASDIMTGRVLNIESKDEDLINFESFLLMNPITEIKFPEFDEPYYTHMEYTLRHLLYKYEKGWITSPRQVMHSSDECISNVHFSFINGKIIDVNVFQRSSNINNIEEDIQFLNYFINKYIGYKVNLNILVSMPHLFCKKKTKVDTEISQ